MSRLAGRGPHCRRLLSCRSPLALALAFACAFLTSLAIAAPAGAAPHMAGVQSHVLWGNVSIDEMDRQLDDMKRAHVAITRVDVGWASVEQEGKGRINWDYVHRLDHLVDGANARGIKLLLMYAETPCWASAAPSSLKQGCDGAWWARDVQNWAPRDEDDFADSMAWVVRRYRGRVYSWEVWNEPNQEYFFHTDDPVGEYAAMVRATYGPVKKADPNAIIVAGSLSDSDFEFTEALYDHGVKGHFDAWSVHPYSDDRSPLNTRVESPRYSFAAGVPATRAVMKRHGDAKPIWLTEFGYSTCNVRGPVSWQNCVDRDTQASYLKQAFRHMRKWSYVPVGIWFNLKNTTGDPGDRVGNYGLLTEDGSEKASFGAFRSVARELEADGAPRHVDEPADPPSTDPPTTDPGATPSPKPRRRAVVRVARRAAYITVRGTAPRRGLARLLLYRRDESTGTFSQRASYRWWFAINRRHRFSLRLRGRALASGTWRVVVVQRRGRHTVTAAAVLGD
jgi:polysaccharide biosynthesis protein PslG